MKVGKALGSGKRLELLDLLAQGERSVKHLACVAGLGVTSTSAHLGTLKAAGLVVTRRDGTRVLYRLAGTDVADLYTRVCQVAATRRWHLGPPDAEAVDRVELLRRVTAGEAVVLDVRPMARCGIYKNHPYSAGAQQSTMAELAMWVIDSDKVITF